MVYIVMWADLIKLGSRNDTKNTCPHTQANESCPDPGTFYWVQDQLIWSSIHNTFLQVYSDHAYVIPAYFVRDLRFFIDMGPCIVNLI